jgi:hypothetical protein
MNGVKEKRFPRKKQHKKFKIGFKEIIDQAREKEANKKRMYILSIKFYY